MEGATGRFRAGIYLRSASNNTLTNSIVRNNHYGIVLVATSNDNKIHLNNFINNTQSATAMFTCRAHPNGTLYNCISPLNNTFSSSEKITYAYNGRTFTNYLGNYWSDYIGSDLRGDGIGDLPYHGVTVGVTDSYPLMKKIEDYFIVNQSTKPSSSPSPSPFIPWPTPTTSPSPTPTAEPLNGTVVLKNGDSYHFLTQEMHKYVNGDFYVLLPTVGKAEFWANNRGQHGLQDLGDIGDMPLDQVSIPEKGYQSPRFGVDVIIGHTYVSLAREGEEGHYIVFRVVEFIAGDHVKLEYLYTP